jgi:hypothetical protein
MDINDLKNAWNQISADNSGHEQLTDERIKKLLSSRTTNLMERIDKNIRWGFAILFLIITLTMIWDFFLAENAGLQIDNQERIPEWVTILDRGVNILIFMLILLFVIRYHYIRRKCSDGCSLRQELIKVIKVLTAYKRLFGLVLIIFLLVSATGYIAGFYKGIHLQGQSGAYLPVAIVLGVVTLFLITSMLFLVLRWGFRKLYGNYLDQLQKMLRELDELD